MFVVNFYEVRTTWKPQMLALHDKYWQQQGSGDITRRKNSADTSQVEAGSLAHLMQQGTNCNGAEDNVNPKNP